MLVLSIPLSRASTNPQTNKARRTYAKRKYSSFINRKGKTGHSLAKTPSCTGKIPKQEKLSQLVKVSIYMYVLMRCCETHALPPRAHIFGALASEGTCVCVCQWKPPLLLSGLKELLSFCYRALPASKVVALAGGPCLVSWHCLTSCLGVPWKKRLLQ